MQPSAWGGFTGPIETEWLPDGRNMRLLRHVTYIDPQGKAWTAPRGHVVDGASIPRFFWRLIGGPLEGPYRNASVIHDYYCDLKTRPWQDVHRMFYLACRAGGCGGLRASLMYWAVYVFGPRW